MLIKDLKSAYLEGIAAFNRGDLNGFFNVFSPAYIHHNPDLPEIHTLDDFRNHSAKFFAAFPGLRVSVENVVAEGTPEAGMLAGRPTFQLTSTGNYPGFPAGQTIEFQGIDMFRFAGGMVVEGWQSNNIVRTLEKLGFMAKA